MTEIEKTLMEYLCDQFEIEVDDPDFGTDVDMFAEGFVDSLGAHEILLFIEKTWNIEITQKDLTLYPMNTVEEIAAVVESKI